MQLISHTFNGYLTKSTVSSIAAQITAVALSALLGIHLARILGAERYGDFVYCYTWLLIAVIPGKLGMDTTVMKYIADYSGRGDYSRMLGIIRFSLSRSFFAASLVSIAAMLVLMIIKNEITDTLFTTGVFTVICIPALSILHVLQYSLYGFRRYVLAQLPESIVRPIAIILATLLLYIFTGSVTSEMVMLLNVSLTLILSFVAFFMLKRISPREIFVARPIFAQMEWRGVGLSMLLISGMNIILSQIDIVLIGYFLGTYDAGLYAAAVRISALVLFFYTAINSVAAPVIARVYAENNLPFLESLSKGASRAIFLLTATLAIGCFVFGDSLLGLFGAEFRTSYLSLVMLVLSQLIRSIVGIGGFLLTMTGHEKISAKLSFASAFINFFLCLMFIPRYGAVGAAIATLASTLVWSFGTVKAVRSNLRILCMPN